MIQIEKSLLVRVFTYLLVVLYLGVLGHYHFTRGTDTVEDVLVSKEFREELPPALVEAVAGKPKVASRSSTAATQPEVPEQPSLLSPGMKVSLAPQHLSPAERYRYYTELAERKGLVVNRTTVIGFRGLAPDGSRHPSTDNATMYDDTFVILEPASERVTVLLGSTHAGQFASTLSPGGVAQIKPGLYRAAPAGKFAEMDCWLVTTVSGRESVPCWRDANGNGVIDPAEKRNGLRATEILFHNGRYQDYGSSIGCQVLPPQLMREFIETVGVSTTFDYLLLDANRTL